VFPYFRLLNIILLFLFPDTFVTDVREFLITKKKKIKGHRTIESSQLIIVVSFHGSSLLGYYFIFGQYWGLNLGLCTWKAGTLPL
jgi:hypothetical protein